MGALFIVGPTASGKSALAMTLAKKLNAELICADSRTIYTGLDVATAKPSKADRTDVVHWGLDLVSPDKRYSAADFKVYADACIKDIQSRGKLPIIVGGTGLYIDGVLFNFTYGPAADPEVRAQLEALTIEQLQDTLVKKGIELPENAKNKRYLIRAIEQGGVNREKNLPMQDAVIIGLLPSRQVLDQRITDRAADMLQQGALAEAQWLFEKYGQDAPAAYAPFFKAFAPHFKDGVSVDVCLERFILNDRQLSKRQVAWFKRNQSVRWFAEAEEAATALFSM